MVLRIIEGYDKSYVIAKEPGHDGYEWRIPMTDFYRTIEKIATYYNDELGDVCLFEVF